MSFQPIHARTPSSYRGVIRFLLCVLVSAIAWAFALDNILQLLWLLGKAVIFAESYYLPSRTLLTNYRTLRAILPGFLSVAVAVTAWHFRMKR
jgi:hypothetical protein